MAIIAVTMGAALVSAALSVASGMGEKVGRSLRAYGANLLIVPRSAAGMESTLDQTGLSILEQSELAAALTGYAPFLFAVAETGGQPVAIVGTWFDAVRTVSPWWQVDGAWIEKRDDRQRALIGVRAAEKLGLKAGNEVVLRYGDLERRFQVAGVVTTGGPEDGQVFVTLAAAQELAGQVGRVNLVQVSVLGAQRPLEAVATEIEAALPDAQVKSVRQVALAERALVDRVELLLGLISLVVLAAAALGVMATMTTAVLERRREIGLMKALGAAERRIAGLFLAEAAAIGLASGVLGYGLGFALAQAIGQSVFASAIALQAWVVPATVGTAMAVTLLASLLPVRRAVAVQPAVVLRGE